MVNRSFAWIDDNAEHSDADYARAAALAKRWSALTSAEEARAFDRMARIEDGSADRDLGCDACNRCMAGDHYNCEQEVYFRRRKEEIQAERDLEIELVEDKLAAIGARMMRPYEHWNEDERYMEYMESER